MILRRKPEDRFSTVAREWEGDTVIIMGGGPSLTVDQIELVYVAKTTEAAHVIAVNDSYLIAPWADVCYAADAKWFVWMTQGISKPKLGLTAVKVRERWATFAGQKCGIHSADPYLPDDVHMLRIANVHGSLSSDQGALATGRQDGYMGHSGFQALNLATLAGAKTIMLVGFDGRPGADGRTHFHGEHPIPTPADVWPHIQHSFSCIENELKAAGVRVMNCSPDSAIGSFEKVPLADALTLILKRAA